jgi:protein-L-isoaspartate O-methyltransferase
VTKAMKVCARNAFLPEAHRNPEEAFVDSPIHLDGLHFNVSAPHMHATCLVRSLGLRTLANKGSHAMSAHPCPGSL